VYLGAAFQETPVYEWSRLEPGQGLMGPAIIESQFTTVLVPPDGAARLDEYGNVVLNL
jgi:N-methylhydantoinase A/oxoprolinase/acetone carboxylase beta subunit